MLREQEQVSTEENEDSVYIQYREELLEYDDTL